MVLSRKKRCAMPSYTEEFKKEAVALYKSGDVGVVRCAQSIGIAPETLRSWVKKFDSEVQALNITEREKLRQLEKDHARLKEENEILRKAAAFFARETETRN